MKSSSYYQEQGHATGYNKTKALAEANKQISAAREATPKKYIHLFVSFISYQDGGYHWGWVLK